MQIRAQFDGLTQLLDSLGQHARQIPYATELAINATARTVKYGTELSMRAEFDRPTPWVMKGLFIDGAKYQEGKLWAEVHVKDDSLGFGTLSMAERIGQQFSGGNGRARGRMEQAFARDGFIAESEYLIAGPDAKRDRFGNMTVGQINQIYAALRLFRDPAQNPTNSVRSRRNRGRAGNIFWSHGDGHSSNLRRGLWARDRSGAPRLILIVVPKVSYKKRIDMQRIAEFTVRRDFRRNFERAMRRAISTAR